MGADGIPLVGRDTETDLLRRRLEAVAGGVDRAHIVFIEGPAGIGKTRLVADAVSGSLTKSVEVRFGAAEELARARPFWALAEALHCRPTAQDPQLREVAGLLMTHMGEQAGPLERVALPQQRFVVLEALLGLIEELAARRPLVLVLDDLQWADPSTLLALQVIGRRLRSLPIAVLACYRPEPPSPDLQAIVAGLRTDGADMLSLGPLPESAVASLVGGLVSARPGEALLRELSGAAGSPLFVTELVRGLLAEGAVEIVNGEAVVAGNRLPASFRLTVGRRLASLSGGAAQLLRVAAVLGTTFAVGDLAAALGRPTVSLLDPLDECFRAGLLADGGPRLAFHHDLVREAIYQDLPAALRHQLHLEIGHALAAAGSGAGLVAHHLARGASPGDAEAVEWLHRAAREAAPTAPAAAVELLETAMDMTTDEEGRIELLPDLAQALVWSGRPGDGEVLARSGLAAATGGAALTLHLVLATSLFVAGRVAESVREVEEVVAQSDLTGHQWTELRAEAALGRLLSGDLAGASRAAVETRFDAKSHGDLAAESLATAVQAWVAHASGRLDEAVDLAQDAADLVGEGESSRYAPHFFLGIVLCSADRLDEAEAAFQRARYLSEGAGGLVSTAVHHCGLALRRFLSGEWDDAQVEAEAGLAFAEERGTGLVVFWLQSMVALLAHRRGDDVASDRALAAAEGHAMAAGPQFGVDWLMWARALVYEERDPELALTVLDNAWELHNAFGVVTHCQTLGPDLVRLALTLGRADRAASVAERIEMVAADSGVASAQGAALRSRGLIGADPAMLAAACTAYEQAGRPFEAAQAAEDAAVALLAVGEPDRARPLAVSALAAYERLGASRPLTRAQAAFRPLGLKGGNRRPPRALSGWSSLTPTEHRVVELVASGLSNRAIGERLFSSRRTVETHVAHVFIKLDLSSRAELAAEATRRRLATSS